MDTKKIELIGDNHELFSLETPLRDYAFVKSNDEKIKNIEKHFTKIVDELLLIELLRCMLKKFSAD